MSWPRKFLQPTQPEWSSFGLMIYGYVVANKHGARVLPAVFKALSRSSFAA